MQTKIVRSGNSKAVIIPAEIARALGWDIGDKIDLQHLATGIMLADPKKGRSARSIGREIMREHAELFQALADR